MASIKDVKSKINQEEFIQILNTIKPYGKLVAYLSSLKDDITSLEEAKPVVETKPKRSYTKKSTNNGETEIK